MAQCQSPEELMKLISRIVDAMVNQYLLCGTLQGGLVACGEDAYLPKDTEVVLCRQLHELVQEGIDTGKIVAPTVVEVRYEGSTLILHLADGENLTLDLKPLIDGVIDQAFTDCDGQPIHVGTALATCANLEAVKLALETKLADLEQKVDNNKALTDQEIANTKALLEQAIADTKELLEQQIAANKELSDQTDTALNKRIDDWIADITERMTLLDESITNKIDAATAEWANTVLQQLIEQFLETRQVYHDESLDGDGHEAAPLKVDVTWLRDQITAHLPEVVKFTDCCGNDIAIGDVLVTCACLETQLTSLTNELKAYAEQQAADALTEANNYTDVKAADTLQQANDYTDEQISSVNMDIPYLRNALANGTEPLVTDNGLALGYNTNASSSNATSLGHTAVASNIDTTALGSGAVAPQGYATAVGCNAEASGVYSTALGSGAVASISHTTALGRNAAATAIGSTAIGSDAVAPQGYTTAVGNDAKALGSGSIALGHNAEASGLSTTAVGSGTEASSTGSTALGRNAAATGSGSTALGYNAGATNSSATALGYTAVASGTDSTSLGRDTVASGSSSTALGRNAAASGSSSTALGASAKASGSSSTALGRSAEASSSNTTALGDIAKATAIYTTALGSNAQATGAASNALGRNAVASGDYSNALGVNAGASNTYSTALGHSATATGVGSTALGFGADAIYDNTTALGVQAAVTGENQVQLGDSATTTYAYGAVQDRSDKRDKTDVHNSDLGLEFIQKLRPVKFRWDYRDDYINELFPKPKREDFIDTSVVNEADYLVEITDVVREPDEPNLSEADFESTESYELAQQAVNARNLERQAKYEEALQARREEQLANLAQAKLLVQEQQEAAYAQALQAHQAERIAFMQNPDERKDGSKARQRYHYGLIADELKGTLDELGVDFGGYQNHANNGGMCVKSVGYTELISPLIKAVQELSAQVDDLKQQLEGK